MATCSRSTSSPAHLTLGAHPGSCHQWETACAVTAIKSCHAEEGSGLSCGNTSNRPEPSREHMRYGCTRRCSCQAIGLRGQGLSSASTSSGLKGASTTECRHGVVARLKARPLNSPAHPSASCRARTPHSGVQWYEPGKFLTVQDGL